MRSPSEVTRERVLDVAHRLFYWNGIHAVGVDRVAREAGVATTTLYRLFGSKDHLVAAYVARADAGYRLWFDGAVAAAGDDPRDRILAVFTAQTEQLDPDQCRGCPFLMTLAEFPDKSHPAHVQAVAMKAWVRNRFAQLAGDIGSVDDPAALADRLVLVLEGAYASVQALGDRGPARQAPLLAAVMLSV